MKNIMDLPEIDWPAGIGKAEKDALRDILHAYDRAIWDFQDDRALIYPTEGERRRLFFSSRRKWLKNWSMPGLCMHPGCSDTSISRSHTIPMSASIKAIAENGHVVAPRFGESGVEVVPLGVREASTFPGFCKIHEAQFADFESKKQMTTAEHFYLQAFRTLCREIYTQRHHKKKLEEGLDDYRRLREAFIILRLKMVQGLTPIDIKGVEFESDALEDCALEHLNSISKNLVDLDDLYHGILDELKGGAGRISMIAATFDNSLPVCLSGIGVLPYQEGNLAKKALCFLAIIPEATETKIFIGAAKEHDPALKAYLSDESSLALLEHLESWICHGSDHWFMTPSAWDALPQTRKDAICERILDPLPSIAEPVEFSVLDSSRNHILAFAKTQLRNGGFASNKIDEVGKLIAEEEAKLNWAARSP